MATTRWLDQLFSAFSVDNWKNIKIKLKILADNPSSDPKFRNLYAYIETKVDNYGKSTLTISDFFYIINEIEVLAYSQCDYGALKKLINKGSSKTAEEKKNLEFNLVEQLEFFKKDFFTTVLNKSDFNDQLAMNEKLQSVFNEIINRRIGFLKSKLSSILKKATEKITDKVVNVFSHYGNEGIHSHFSNIKDLIDSDFRIDNLGMFFLKYQEEVLYILYETTFPAFVDLLSKMTDVFLNFLCLYPNLKDGTERMLSGLAETITIRKNDIANNPKISPRKTKDIFYNMLHAKEVKDEKSIFRKGSFYDKKAEYMIKHPKDFQSIVYHELIELKEFLSTKNLIGSDKSLSTSSGSAVNSASSAGKNVIVFISDSTLNKIPLAGTLLHKGVVALAGFGIDAFAEKLSKKLGHPVTKKTEMQFKDLIYDENFDLRKLANSFVESLFLVFPDAFNRIHVVTESTRLDFMEKLAGEMKKVLLYFTDQLSHLFHLAISDDEKYHRMSLVLVESFILGCESRFFFQGVIRNFDVDMFNEDGKLERVDLFKMFTKFGYIGIASEKHQAYGFKKGDFILFAPQNNLPEYVDAFRCGFGFIDMDSDEGMEKLGLGFQYSCVKANMTGQHNYWDKRIKYDQVASRFKNRLNPYALKINVANSTNQITTTLFPTATAITTMTSTTSTAHVTTTTTLTPTPSPRSRQRLTPISTPRMTSSPSSTASSTPSSTPTPTPTPTPTLTPTSTPRPPSASTPPSVDTARRLTGALFPEGSPADADADANASPKNPNPSQTPQNQ